MFFFVVVFYITSAEEGAFVSLSCHSDHTEQSFSLERVVGMQNVILPKAKGFWREMLDESIRGVSLSSLRHGWNQRVQKQHGSSICMIF